MHYLPKLLLWICGNGEKVDVVYGACPTAKDIDKEIWLWYGTSHFEDSVSIFECHKSEVVSPQKLKKDPVGWLVRSALLLISLDLPINSARRDTAMGQPIDKTRES